MAALDTPRQASAPTDDVAAPFTIAVANQDGTSLMTVTGALDLASARSWTTPWPACARTVCTPRWTVPG
jgi:hypothetical protein